MRIYHCLEVMFECQNLKYNNKVPKSDCKKTPKTLKHKVSNFIHLQLW